MVFFGEFRGKIDKQGRVVIPSKLRNLLKNKSVYITRGLENCLFIFSEKVWESQSEKLKNLPFTKGDPRAFTRLFFSGAYQSKIDRQGRILIPSNLLDYAGIKERIVIIGVGTRIELWAEERWDKYFSHYLSSYSEIAEKLVEL
ncbi:MAG: division/cell wall cluster transcriptional repressor MraZ [Candidatus Omnitrophota bacterium]|nr:MAG: division/cell wall cluster transcriptional repressor MraZ [Candidatus Omnitrophota bacterium]